MTNPYMQRIGLTAASVRIMLTLPPLPERQEARPEFHYVTSDDRERRLAEVEQATPLMIGLALAGMHAQGEQGIAAICGCSPSAVKKRLREAGVQHARGKPRKR